MSTIDRRTLGRYMAGWLGLVVLMIINGTARNFLYGPYMAELTAHQASTVTGVALVYAATWLMNRRWRIPDRGTAWAIGAAWLLATVVFEFGFGHYVMGHGWDKLLHDYNLFAGRVWLMLLAATAVIPFAVYTMSAKEA